MTINHFLAKIASTMDESFEKKCDEIKKKLAPLSKDERYQALIHLGRSLPTYPPALKTPDRLVPGCQSLLYLNSKLIDDKIYFECHSDALISSGLAALLLSVYSGESPETVLKCPPHFIHELELTSSLSLNRSNGLANIHLRMKQEALKYIIDK